MSTATAADPILRLVSLRVDQIRPAPENDLIYRPISINAPDIVQLAKEIEEEGLLQPLQVTNDDPPYIADGHRRWTALHRLGRAQEHVSCVQLDISRMDPRFEKILVTFNSQRVKSFAEVMREVAIKCDPEAAYANLIAHRARKSAVKGAFIDLGNKKVRAKISAGKKPMLMAAVKVINENAAFWPLSDRAIHYFLLNDPPPIHANDPSKVYENNQACYKNLCRLLTQARLEGYIPHNCIDDPTRKTAEYGCLPDVGKYLAQEVDDLLTTYWRDLQQSQPNHIEIVGEKNTVESSIKDVARKYRIPYTLGRGYASLDPRWKMCQRFKASGKDKLIVLVMSDFDPEGEDIAHSFARSMRDDFGVKVEAKKVCLTYQQVMERNLPQTFDIKKTSSRYKKHAKRYGDRAHELEALPTVLRSELLDEAIRSVLDIDAFNIEVEKEKKDEANLDAIRSQLGPMLRDAVEELDEE